MSEADPKLRRSAGGAMPLPECVALVLQGGGALGSYQAGVYEGLIGAGVDIDWVAGISIGGINGALIAGNPPERRIDALRSFWRRVTQGFPSLPIDLEGTPRELAHQWAAGSVLLTGVPGMFRPHLINPWFALPGTVEALSFYSTEPLQRALEELVDWDLLNDGPVRLSIGAVNVETGNFAYFDTHEQRIDVRHVMASGALPPGLPPVGIDGCWYWDGGLVSNTPLTHILDHQDAPMLVFQVDLFSAQNERPATMMDVLAREKEIRYSSRTRKVSHERMALRQEREAIRKVLAKLPADLLDDPDVQALAARAAELPVNLVHLIFRPNAWEGGGRDFEFSARSMHEHWLSGRLAVDETMANAQIVARNIQSGETAEFDLTHR